MLALAEYSFEFGDLLPLNTSLPSNCAGFGLIEPGYAERHGVRVRIEATALEAAPHGDIDIGVRIPVLRRHFTNLRRKRTQEGQRFLDGLVARGFIRRLGHPDEFALLTTNTSLLTNHWLNFVESTGQMDEQALQRGYLVMLNMIRPYTTERGLRDFERLADPKIEVDTP
jgi:hypothetical protein